MLDELKLLVGARVTLDAAVDAITTWHQRQDRLAAMADDPALAALESGAEIQENMRKTRDDECHARLMRMAAVATDVSNSPSVLTHTASAMSVVMTPPIVQMVGEAYEQWQAKRQDHRRVIAERLQAVWKATGIRRPVAGSSVFVVVLWEMVGGRAWPAVIRYKEDNMGGEGEVEIYRRGGDTGYPGLEADLVRN